jgi:hypothetical protein
MSSAGVGEELMIRKLRDLRPKVCSSTSAEVASSPEYQF